MRGSMARRIYSDRALCSLLDNSTTSCASLAAGSSCISSSISSSISSITSRPPLYSSTSRSANSSSSVPSSASSLEDSPNSRASSLRFFSLARSSRTMVNSFPSSKARINATMRAVVILSGGSCQDNSAIEEEKARKSQEF